MRLELDSPVRDADGVCGKLGDFVVNPRLRRLTHLVVEPEGSTALARLVPAGLAQGGPDGQVTLRCSADRLRRMLALRESAYMALWELPESDPDWDIGVQDVLPAPGFGFPELGPDDPDPYVWVSYDRIPAGEVELRRESVVTGADGGSVGRVDGLLVAPDEAITHVLLGRRRKWRRRQVAVPVTAVERLETDEIRLKLDKAAVRALPETGEARRATGGAGRRLHVPVPRTG